MALALQPAPSLPRPSSEVLRRWAGPSLSLVVCVAGLTQLVPPALRDNGTPTGGRVSVQVLGTLSTEGLPDSARVSMLTVRNDGPAAVSWSARPSVAGPGAAAVDRRLRGGDPAAHLDRLVDRPVAARGHYRAVRPRTCDRLGGRRRDTVGDRGRQTSLTA